jgi:hypothetical protein
MGVEVTPTDEAVCLPRTPLTGSVATHRLWQDSLNTAGSVRDLTIVNGDRWAMRGEF